MNDTDKTSCTRKAGNYSKSFRYVVLATALIAVVSLSACMGGYRHGPWGGSDRMTFMVDRMADRLDLTDEQRVNVETIMSEGRIASEPHLAELKELRTDMKQLIQTDEFYDDQARITLESKTDAMVELMVIVTRSMHDVRAQLTPEQLAEADKMMKRFAEKRARRAGKPIDEEA